METPTPKEPRYSLEEWQDILSLKKHGFHFNTLKDACSTLVWMNIELDALQAFHDQEMKAKDEEIPKWISVEERLPEKNEPLLWFNDETNQHEVFMKNAKVTVLAYHPDLGQFKANFDKMGWTEISSISSSRCYPTHWQPLPTPPPPTV